MGITNTNTTTGNIPAGVHNTKNLHRELLPELIERWEIFGRN